MQALVAFIIGDAVAHFRIHPPVVISVKHFAQEHKIRLQPAGQAAELLR